MRCQYNCHQPCQQQPDTQTYYTTCKTVYSQGQSGSSKQHYVDQSDDYYQQSGGSYQQPDDSYQQSGGKSYGQSSDSYQQSHGHQCPCQQPTHPKCPCHKRPPCCNYCYYPVYPIYPPTHPCPGPCGAGSCFRLLTAADLRVFQTATTGLTGVTYTPLLVSTQVTNGTTYYAFLAQATPVTPNPVSYYAIIYVTQSRTGQITLGTITPIPSTII
ncbi:MAG: hypothetical protein E7231_07695 [Cellulosilyticum sp.]|nr:hypothetical protein [Cellulosilyticum sp.]